MSKIFRFTCIVCPLGCYVEAELEGENLKIHGCKCSRGEEWVRSEIFQPKRILVSVIKVKNGVYPVASVKTDRPVPKDKIFQVMKFLSNLEISAPVKMGQVIVKNVLDTGANIVATRDVDKK